MNNVVNNNTKEFNTNSSSELNFNRTQTSIPNNFTSIKSFTYSESNNNNLSKERLQDNMSYNLKKDSLKTQYT